MLTMTNILRGVLQIRVHQGTFPPDTMTSTHTMTHISLNCNAGAEIH